ncbi:MAG: Gfo/Idh/MocA family oxidoreductase [Anaerolineales bacterium]
MVSADYRFSYDYPERLPVALIGAGDHSAHYIVPCLRYLPIDLVAVADPDRRRGMQVAKQCGAQRFYPDHETLLEKEHLRAVIVSLPLAADGTVPYVDVAAAALAGGVHAWIDAPAAGLASQVSKQYTDAALRGRAYLMAGYRRPFMPGYGALKAALEGAKLKPTTYSLWCALPSAASAAPLDLGTDLLGLLPHPIALLTDLFGEANSVQWLWHSDKQGLAMTLGYATGLVGQLQLSVRPAGAAATEALTVRTADRLWRVEDGLHLAQESGATGGWTQQTAGVRAGASALEEAGYLGALRYFCEVLLAGAPVGRMNILHLLQVMNVQAALRSGRDRQWVTV